MRHKSFLVYWRYLISNFFFTQIKRHEIYLLGIWLLLLGAILIYSFAENFSYKPLIQSLNIAILFGFGIYYIFFKKKKEAIFEDNRLILKKGSRKIKQLDLSQKKRIVTAYSELKIIFDNQREKTFKYSEFDKNSVQILKSLSWLVSYFKYLSSKTFLWCTECPTSM